MTVAVSLSIEQPLSTIATYWYSPGAPGLTHSSLPVPTSVPLASSQRTMSDMLAGLTTAVRQAVSPTHSFSGSGVIETVTASVISIKAVSGITQSKFRLSLI